VAFVDGRFGVALFESTPKCPRKGFAYSALPHLFSVFKKSNAEALSLKCQVLLRSLPFYFDNFLSMSFAMYSFISECRGI